MKTQQDTTPAELAEPPGSADWHDYGKSPPESGEYNLRIRAKDGREKTIEARCNLITGHWFIGVNECGYANIILPPGELDEWRITHWQNAQTLPPEGAQ